MHRRVGVSTQSGPLTNIPGIGLMTAIVVVAETSGFVLVENELQLASYDGLDMESSP